MDIAEPTAEPRRDLDVHMVERQPKRRRELEDVEMRATIAREAYEICGTVARGAARGKLVRAKWLDDWGKNGMRSRLMAQHFNWAKRDDVTQNGRCAISRQQSVIVWTQGWSRGAESGSVAFYHAPFDEIIVVVPPKGVCPVGVVLQLRRAMDGTKKLGGQRRHRGAGCNARGPVRRSGCRAHVLLMWL